MPRRTRGELWRTYGEPARGRAAPGRPCTTSDRTAHVGTRSAETGRRASGRRSPLPRSRATRLLLRRGSPRVPGGRVVARPTRSRVSPVSEALSLRWADVDLDAGTLRVRGTKTAASCVRADGGAARHGTAVPPAAARRAGPPAHDGRRPGIHARAAKRAPHHLARRRPRGPQPGRSSDRLPRPPCTRAGLLVRRRAGGPRGGQRRSVAADSRVTSPPCTPGSSRPTARRGSARALSRPSARG